MLTAKILLYWSAAVKKLLSSFEPLLPLLLALVTSIIPDIMWLLCFWVWVLLCVYSLGKILKDAGWNCERVLGSFLHGLSVRFQDLTSSTTTNCHMGKESTIYCLVLGYVSFGLWTLTVSSRRWGPMARVSRDTSLSCMHLRNTVCCCCCSAAICTCLNSHL